MTIGGVTFTTFDLGGHLTGEEMTIGGLSFTAFDLNGHLTGMLGP